MFKTNIKNSYFFIKNKIVYKFTKSSNKPNIYIKKL